MNFTGKLKNDKKIGLLFIGTILMFVAWD